MLDLLVRARRAVVGGAEVPVAVAVQGGRIVDLLALDADAPAHVVVELADDEVLLPGLVDTHVHVDEPGRSDWEGFETATRAAAAGGVTTLVDMPLNSIPPTVDVAALRTKQAATQGKCYVDVAFWGGAVPGNTGSLAALHEAGVLGFKCFLVDSGVEEFGSLDDEGLARVLDVVAGLGALLLVHAEDAGVLSSAPLPEASRYQSFLASRPPLAETRAVERLLAGAERTGARVHVLHVSSGDVVPLLVSARRRGVRVSAETCPHYLVLGAETVPDGATEFKCCPPVRETANADRLWTAIAAGEISAVVSDHSPSPPELKAGGFAQAWGGISSLQLGLPLMWTAARDRGHGLADVVAWMASGPAAVAGLSRKGSIAVGGDADLVALAPDESFVVDATRLHHRHPITPYAGTTLQGVVRRTWLRGEVVDVTAAPRGTLLTREELPVA